MAAMSPEPATVGWRQQGGRGIVMRVPLEGGGRLVVELTPDGPPHWAMSSRTSRG